MFRALIFLLCSLLSINTKGQYQLEMDAFQSSFYAQKIDTNQIQSHVSFLSSQELAGRETGTVGLKMAGDYIINQLKGSGIQPFNNQYEQAISMAKTYWNTIALSINGKSYEHLQDFISLPHWNKNLPNVNLDQILFLGYGIESEEYNDYEKANVRGKTIMILGGVPFDEQGNSYITDSLEKNSWVENWEKKLALAAHKGARFVIMVDPNIQQTIAKHRNTILNAKIDIRSNAGSGKNYPNNLFISSSLAKQIVGDKLKTYTKNLIRIQNSGMGRALRLTSDINIQQHLMRMANYANNIVGYIEGDHPILKDEFVIISAHYDHLGERGASIFPGADDNGSGTSTVLEIMKKFALAKSDGVEFKRSIMCIFFAGEEKGLLGSKFYTENPIVPLEKTIANINVDMIGRVDAAHEANPYYIYVIGADRISQELHDINEMVNQTFTNLYLDYTYNEEDDPNRFYYRSDHYNFAKHGIPSIFYFSGVHEDYHQPGDIADKIMFFKMYPIAQLIFQTAWEIASKIEPLRID